MNTTSAARQLEIVPGDITQLEVDAIVNAANNELWMGRGVAGAIKRVGGEAIEKEAMALAPIEVGDAVATTGDDLKARWVIHAAVMGQDLQTDAAAIAKATTSSLAVAERCGARASRCRPSAPAWAASRSTRAPASWWARCAATWRTTRRPASGTSCSRSTPMRSRRRSRTRWPASAASRPGRPPEGR